MHAQSHSLGDSAQTLRDFGQIPPHIISVGNYNLNKIPDQNKGLRVLKGIGGLRWLWLI